VIERMATGHSQVLRTQHLVFALLLLLSASGCSRPKPMTLAEPSFVQQLASVKAGHSQTIDVSSWWVLDADIVQLADATALRALLIDYPESRITAAGLKHLADLPNLEHIRLRGPGVDDKALAEIGNIVSLRILNLPRGEFSDAGLEHLKALPQLVQLRFHSPAVTDAGMGTLAEFPSLARLHLIDVPITDSGLKTLAGIGRLESLYIDGGDFSNAAIDELFRARPDLHVHLNQQHHDRDPNKHP
jgi:hypothetical protein